jgi:hypothetical protein
VLKSEATTGRTILLPLAMAYGVASLVHFSHNAIYLRQYPDMPPWLTAAGVCLAWCGVAALGIAGYWVYLRASRRVGLLILALYAALGFAGLDHYAIAPVARHSFAMNMTILCEVASAAALLLVIARHLLAERTQMDAST